MNLVQEGSIVHNQPYGYCSTSIYGSAVKGITKLFAMFEDQAPYPFMILVESAPGIRKTILSKEIASQWASKAVLKNQKLLFLFIILS